MKVKKIQAQKAEQSVEEIKASCKSLAIWLSRTEAKIDSSGSEKAKLLCLRDECKERGETLQRLQEISAELEVQHISHNASTLRDLQQRLEAAQKAIWKDWLSRR